MSFFDSIGKVAHGVGDFAGGVMHAGEDMVGGQLHAAGDLAGGAMHAGQDLAGGAMSAGGHMMGGLSHGWSDLMHGNIGGAIGDVAGGAMHAAGDLAGGQMAAMGHLGGGAMHAAGDLAGGALHAGQDLAGGVMHGLVPAGMAGYKLFNDGKNIFDMFKGNLKPGEGKGDGIGRGLGGINDLLGFGKSSKKEEDKDHVDKDLDHANSGLGVTKTVLGKVGKVNEIAENAAKGLLPGGGMIEKLTNGAFKESELAAKASKVLGPVNKVMESGAGKILEGPVGKFLDGPLAKFAAKEGEQAAVGAAGKLAGKLIPGVNIAMAGISAFESGKDAAERWKKGDKLGAAIEGLHTVTNLAGAFPGVGGAISAGGDLVAGAAHWLADGGAKKIGSMVGGAASAVSGAVGGAASAVGGAVSGVASGAANVAGKVAGAVGGAASAVGGAVGGAAKAVGGAVSGAAKKIFGGGW